VIIRGNVNPEHIFNTGQMFYPYAEVMVCNENVSIQNEIPFRLVEKMDMYVSIISTNAAGSGPATCVLRGWIENN